MRDYPKELLSNLRALFIAENNIAEIIQKTGLRFSTNKMTADLGEYYAHKALTSIDNLFELITPQLSSNAEFDLLGVLSANSVLSEKFNSKEIRIEVKTRRAQEGVKYLGSVKPQKFDILCVVDMAKNYSLNKVHLVTTETAEKFLDRKYNRLIFSENMAFMTFE